MAEKKTLTQTEECKYPRKDLVNSSVDIFGVNQEVVIGALYGNNAEEFTVSEVKEAIKNFNERKVE